MRNIFLAKNRFGLVFIFYCTYGLFFVGVGILTRETVWAEPILGLVQDQQRRANRKAEVFGPKPSTTGGDPAKDQNFTRKDNGEYRIAAFPPPCRRLRNHNHPAPGFKTEGGGNGGSVVPVGRRTLAHFRP